MPSNASNADRWMLPPACNLVLQAVYGVLKEAEHRSTFYIPYWDLPFAK